MNTPFHPHPYPGELGLSNDDDMAAMDREAAARALRHHAIRIRSMYDLISADYDDGNLRGDAIEEAMSHLDEAAAFLDSAAEDNGAE